MLYYILFCSFYFVFFFKQKTAYEMRISDWSSDVCSSDLNLARRIGRPIDGALDDTLLDRLPGANIYGPVAPVDTTGTLALAAANADFSIAEAGVRLARANRVPDLNVGPAIRRLEAPNDMAAVFTVSIPTPALTNGRAALAQAHAQRTQAANGRKLPGPHNHTATTAPQATGAQPATAGAGACGR